MKLSEWPTGFDYPGTTEQISAQMTDLKATEVAALLLQDDGDPRALIATDVALLDCRYLGDEGPGIEIVVTAWDAVPVPWITYAWFGSADSATMTFSLSLDPQAKMTYSDAAERDAARAFYLAVLQHRRR